MGFMTAKAKQVAPAAAPAVVASPTETLNSVARLRRLKGGRNSFDASAPSSAAQSGQTKPNTVTGVQG